MATTYREIIRQSPLGLLLLAVCFCGCDSIDIGTVTGTIYVDGKPLEGARVLFYPEPDGRFSSSLTDEDGAYELVYSRSIYGAKVGEHKVRITTAVDNGEGPSRETLPAKYNVETELRKVVKPGKNTINFDLNYDGEVIQPQINDPVR